MARKGILSDCRAEHPQVDLLGSLHSHARGVMAKDGIPLGAEQGGPFAEFCAESIALALLRDCAFQQH